MDDQILGNLHPLAPEEIIPRMANVCPECRTAMDANAPYCEACGYQFPKVPAAASSNGCKFLAYGIVAMLAIVLAAYLRYC
jgi:predicted amidophosphoribosyltransferase